VDDGMSIRKASNTYNIPYSSFCSWCYGKTRSRDRGTKGVLTVDEENQLVEYLIEMCNRGLGLSPTQLKMKVYEITKDKWTPFKNGIPGGGRMTWWRRRHPKLSLRTSQALEAAGTSGLCEENVASFYDNLENLTSTHGYSPGRIWNCDESGAQADKNHSL
jgi:hypothetical protein